MASLDVIALDTATPQLRAPAVGDSYHFCRVAEFQDGTALEPGITNVGDLNTGIYFPATDTLGVTAGGVESFRAGAAEVVVNETGANIDTRIEGDTDANLVFVDASTDRIGVGTATPSQKVDIASGNLIFSSTAQRIYGNFGGTWANRTIFQNYNSNTETRVGAMPNGTSDTATFSVSNNSSPNNSGSGSIRINSTALSLNSNSEGTGTPLPMHFNLYNGAESSGGVSVTRMVITTAGNVGIGNSYFTPGSELDVKGTLRLSGATSGYVGLAAAAAAGSTTYTLPSADGTNGQVLVTNGSGVLSWAASDADGVDGPASATDEALARFDGTTGKLIQNSNATLTDAGVLTLTQAAVINESGADSDTRIEGDTDANLVFVDASADFVGIGTASPAAKLDIGSGNLTFSSTAQRITGDMSNATHANRLSFQSSVTNGATSPFIIPNGTGTTASIVVANASDPTNSSFGQFIANGSTDVRVTSGILGTGSYLPMTFYTGGSERVRIDTSGNVGIGGTAGADTKVNALGTYPTSGTVTRVFLANGTIPSGTTGEANGFQSILNTQAASFTLTNLYHFQANGGTVGSGSTVTNQYGFGVASTLTGATNNYGFYSNIASAANRWNFYAAGTAQNYFAGDVSIGTTPVSSYRFSVYGSGTTSATASAGFWNSTGTSQMYLRDDNYFNSGAINNYSVAGTTVVIDGSNFLGKTTSSLRYKKDIVNYNKGVDAINALRPVYYKSAIEGPNGFDPKQHAGFVAEEIAESGFEEFLIRDSEGRPEAVQYPHMVALLVKAVQELTARVAELEAK